MRAKTTSSLLPCILTMTVVAMLANVNGLHAQSIAGAKPQEQIRVQGLAFAVVTIKPSLDSEADDWGIGVRGRNFWAVHVTTNELVEWAYGINSRQIEHAPGWFATERFDVQGVPDPDAKPARDQYRAMLKSALAERFALRFQSSRKILPVYVLSLSNGTLKIPMSVDQSAKPSWGVHQGWLSIQCMTFDDVARVMQRTIFDRPVLDQTGLPDRYTFILKWQADETQFTQMQGVEVPQEEGTEDVEDIYTAARRQLGIKIEARKELAPTMVVQTALHPSPN